MQIKKPKFWDIKNITFLSFILIPFSIIVYFYNLIKFKPKKLQKFQIPIICVGNIYIGGTGKTPISIEIYKMLKSIGKKPGIIKKYYKYLRDENKLISDKGKIYLNENRSLAIKKLIGHGDNIAILDDGLQENIINYDLSIVCFNQKQWIGNGFIIPSGPLRESFSSIKRFDCIMINGKKNKQIEKKIYSINPNINIFYFNFKLEKIFKIKNKKIIPFAGIGNPENFFNLLKKEKLNIVKSYSFPDHYNFSRNDLNKLKKQSKIHNATLVTTEKDYQRLKINERKKIICLKIKTILNNKKNFLKVIKKII